MEVHHIDISRIMKGPLVRQDLGDLDELARSLAADGLLNPILVRPMGKDYELVAGERRLEAAKKAGFATIPSTVRDIDELEARALQLVENIQRQDASPLDEADAIAWFREHEHLSDDDICVRLSLSPKTLQRRTRLLGLSPASRDLVEAGVLPLAHAELVSVLPEADQAEALKGLKKGDVPALPRFLEDIRRQGQHIDRAPFPTDNPARPGGACGVCPKRTGAQPALFGEAEEGDGICLDSSCWQANVQAEADELKASVLGGGGTVVTKKEAEAARNSSKSQFVREHDWRPFGGQVNASTKDVLAALGKAERAELDDARFYIPPDKYGAPTGEVAYERKALLEALKKSKTKRAKALQEKIAKAKPAPAPAGDKAQAKDRAAREREARKREAHSLAARDIVSDLAKGQHLTDDMMVLELVLYTSLMMGDIDFLEGVFGEIPRGAVTSAALYDIVKGVVERCVKGELSSNGVMVALLVGPDLELRSAMPKYASSILDRAGVDLKGYQKAAELELKQRDAETKKAKAEEAKAKRAKAKTKKGPMPAEEGWTETKPKRAKKGGAA